MRADTDKQATSRRALERYHSRLRPWRIGYAAAIVVVLAAAVVIVKVAYNHGEISHATLRTAATPLASIPVGTPSATATDVLPVAWRSTDRAAIGTPYWGGTVVTYSDHTVSGRDARTGKAVWSYTRTDRTVCTAAQIGGVTIAVYELNGNCDELTAVDSQTGARRWTRTLDKDGHPVNGHPTYSVGQFTFMVTTPQVIYALSPDGTADTGNGGLDRWVFSQQGCTINSAVLGSQGALISQTCAQPNCGERQYCGRGPQLLLRDPTAGEDTDDAKNPDKITWNLIGSTLRPVSADGVVSAVQPGGSTLTLLDQAKGSTLAEPALASPATGTPGAAAIAHGEILRIGGTAYSIGDQASAFSWSRPIGTMPTLFATNFSWAPDASTAVLTTPTPDGVAELDLATGASAHAYRLQTPPPADARVYPLGTGFLVAGNGIAVYR